MEIIINLWNNWTSYEKLTLGFLLLFILLLIPLSIYIFTKHKTLVLISFLSLLISGVLTLISFFVLNQIFGVTIVFLYKLVPFIILFVDILSLGTMTGYYTQNHKHKEFNVLEMKKEMLRDTFRLTIALLLLLTGISILTQSILLLLLLTLGLSLAIIWINYTLLYRMYK